jgi:phenol 2-monooxygenase
MERRLHAANVVELSGKYLRYCCNSDEPVPHTHEQGKDLGAEAIEHAVRGKPYGFAKPGEKLPEHLYLADYYHKYGAFMLGLDVAYGKSALFPRQDDGSVPVVVDNGVRAPNPRVSLSSGTTGYLYDVMQGARYFHIVVFASSLEGLAKQNIQQFAQSLSDPSSFYTRYGGKSVFNIVVVIKRLPFELDTVMAGPEFQTLKDVASTVFDDQPPDEDAHTMWGVDHGTGAVVVVRPDLWVGRSVRPDRIGELEGYFSGFLNPQVKKGVNGFNGVVDVNGAKDVSGVNGTNGVNGVNGVNGANALDGANGVNGVNGANGVDGVNGANGHTHTH